MTDYKKKYLEYKKKYVDLKNQLHGGSSSSYRDLRVSFPYLVDKNPFLINERADGTCLFRAFARMLYNDPEQHLHVRTDICFYLLCNNNIVENSIVTDEFPTYYDYIEDMMSEYTYGDAIELQAFCNLYGCTVIVHDLPDDPELANPLIMNRRIRTIEPTTINESLLLNTNRQLDGQIFHLFRNGEHYQTLRFNNSSTTKTF